MSMATYAQFNTLTITGRVSHTEIVEKDGDKIIVRLASQGSFTSGSSNLRQAFTPTLARLGNSLAQYPGSVMVEGHTDNVPVAFSERFNNAWVSLRNWVL